MTPNSRLAILLGLLLVSGVALYLLRFSRKQLTSVPIDDAGRVTNALAAGSARIAAREDKADATAWAAELLAEKCGRRIESLWDAINASSNKLEVVRNFPVGQVVLSQWAPPREFPHAVFVREPIGDGDVISATDWRALLEDATRAGWRLVQTEFRHRAFDQDEPGRPKQSRFYFSAHLVNDGTLERAALEGDLWIHWGEIPAGADPPEVRSVDASRLTLKTRRGDPAFQLILDEELTPPPGNHFVDPLILYDLDGDGLSQDSQDQPS